MELDQFIEETLKNIVSGVDRANERMGDGGIAFECALGALESQHAAQAWRHDRLRHGR